jgi:putative acetyltransferase
VQPPASDSGSGLVVRPERPEDVEPIGHVLKLAFGRVNEAELVERVRATPYYVPDLALVAEDEGEIVGHALWSYVELQTDEESLAVLALAPLAVRPDRQHEGVGVALVEAGLEAAAERREPIALVLGYPRYYGRFGFEPARAHGISPPSPEIPDDVFMVKLLPGYDGRPRGRVVYPPAFDGV